MVKGRSIDWSVIPGHQWNQGEAEGSSSLVFAQFGGEFLRNQDVDDVAVTARLLPIPIEERPVTLLLEPPRDQEAPMAPNADFDRFCPRSSPKIHFHPNAKRYILLPLKTCRRSQWSQRTEVVCSKFQSNISIVMAKNVLSMCWIYKWQN